MVFVKVIAKLDVLITPIYVLCVLQDTLAEATALLTELEAQEHSDMETNGDTSEKDETTTKESSSQQDESQDTVDERLWQQSEYCDFDTLD